MNPDSVNLIRPAAHSSRSLRLALGGLALAGAGVAAGLGIGEWRSDQSASLPVAASTLALATPAPRDAPTDALPPSPAAADSTATVPVTKPRASAAPRATPSAASDAPACTNCGVVESVRSVERKGPGTGVGAVAGGVVGAALGNQIGKGSGRAAMTVLGAVGGGFAGHEVERRVRTVTRYEVRVRMDNGALRTVTLAHGVAIGSRVSVAGNTLHQTASAPPQAVRVGQRSAGT